MIENQEIIENSSSKKLWLWVFITIPSLFIIAGIATLIITFSGSFNNGDNSGKTEDQKSIKFAKTFNFRADIHIDVSVLKVIVSADTSPGPENLFMDLQNKSDSSLFHQVRLFNSGNNIYRGTLPDVLYGEWKISLYPENQQPTWRINDESIFPNNIVSIAAK